MEAKIAKVVHQAVNHGKHVWKSSHWNQNNEDFKRDSYEQQDWKVEDLHRQLGQ